MIKGTSSVDMIPLDRTVKKQTVLSGGIIMPHKEKYPLECKLAICNAILHGTLTISGAARQYHIGYATIRDWLLTYQSDGTGGLVPGRHCKSYSPDLKWSAVQDYLSGKGTATQIGTKYRIKSIDRLRVWIKRYNSHDEFKLRSGGSTVMTKTRKTTEEERLEIVEYCVAHDNNYGEAALKYRVSYQQVYQWARKYRQMGRAGLQDRRGKRIGSMPSRTPEEALRDRVAELEHQNRMLRIERDVLKKMQELERRDAMAIRARHVNTKR